MLSLNNTEKETMNLYFIKQDANKEYESISCAVVAAESEEEARNMHPSNGLPAKWPEEPIEDDDFLNQDFLWCDSPDDVEVELLGISINKTFKGVVCKNYRS